MLGIRNKNALVLGINNNGIELCKFLMREGAQVALADTRSEESLDDQEKKLLEDFRQIPLYFGEYTQALFDRSDLVIVSAGIPVDLSILDTARTMGKQVYSELEFVSLYAKQPIIAIAGTNGKSTAAHILSSILSHAGKKCFSNATQPLAAYLNSSENYDHLICVCTSFQLEGVQNFKPSSVVFLNLAPDHGHWYPNYETYLAANREVLKNIDSTTQLILNANDENIVNFVQGLPGRYLFFGSQTVPEGFEGAWGERGFLYARCRESGSAPVQLNLKNLRLRGPHNKQNIMAAVLCALSLGVTPQQVQEALLETRPLPHRLQFIKRINSVAFYDDSCAANPHAVIHSLHSFHEPIILVMGGKDKETEFSVMAQDIRQKVKNLIIVGDAKEKINRAIGDYTETFIVGTIEEAVLMAYQKSRSGDVVLFSPGCDSRNLFATHEERGENYKKLVNLLAVNKKRSII